LNWRFSISRKLGLGFGLFIAVVGFVFYITNNTLEESRKINQRINEIYAPSLHALENLDKQMTRTMGLLTEWTHIQRNDEWQERQELIHLSEKVIPQSLLTVRFYAENWSRENLVRLNEVENAAGNLMNLTKEVRRLLPNHQSYVPENQMVAEFYFLEGEDIPKNQKIMRDNLEALIAEMQQVMKAEINQMNGAFDKLRLLLVNTAIVVLIGGMLIAFLTARSIVRPVTSLKRKLVNLGQGIYSTDPVRAGNDEIGDMADAVSRLVTNFEKTKEFSTQVGAGNFNVSFTPLSEHDELGKALLRMREDLASYRNEMETKVAEQTREIRIQKDQVEQQRERVTALYTDLQASIRYAQRLQESVLPSDEYIHQLFPDSFIFFRPKATVSGDFYWFRQQGGKKIFAAADCTGHGVPGAFMSLVGHNVLNQVTKVFTKPSQILNNLNRMASEVMRNRAEGDTIRDGMDVALCTLDPETLVMEFSGAHNPIYLVRDGEMTKVASDPHSIGSFVHGEREFSNQVLQLQKGDCLYLFSDGYSDQFGGPSGKKFMRRQFRTTIMNIQHLPMAEQKWRLSETLDRWQGDLEQVDDILVMGIRI